MKKKTRGFQGSLSSSSSTSTSKSRWPRESEAISQERRKSSNKTSHLIAVPCRDLGSLFSQAPRRRRRPIHFWGAAATPLLPLSSPSMAATGAADWDHSSKNVVVIRSPSRSWTTRKPAVATHCPVQTRTLRACVFTNSEKTVKLLFHGACFGGFTFSAYTFRPPPPALANASCVTFVCACARCG